MTIQTYVSMFLAYCILFPCIYSKLLTLHWAWEFCGVKVNSRNSTNLVSRQVRVFGWHLQLSGFTFTDLILVYIFVWCMNILDFFGFTAFINLISVFYMGNIKPKRNFVPNSQRELCSLLMILLFQTKKKTQDYESQLQKGHSYVNLYGFPV